jgi:purine nucleoside phosphorylase
MTGANEAELLNELAIPFAMFGIVDNMANGIGEKLTVSKSLESDKKKKILIL